MSNYRVISIMSAATKVYNRLLLNRLRPLLDPILRKNQAGFRQGRSTIGQICALRRIFEGAQRKQLPLVATFVDFRKAFDSINRESLFEIMANYGVPSQLISAVKVIYDNSKAVVAVNGNTSESFKITTGVLQGDVLAPFLFILVIDSIMCSSEENFGFTYELAKSSRHPAKKINDLDFADDIVLLENCIEMANKQLAKLCEEAAKVGLLINEDKTEVMTFNLDKEHEAVYLNGKALNEVQDFKYLGAHMASTEIDYNYRRGQAWGAYVSLNKIWSAKHLSARLKANIFEASVLSILLYGCESWIVTDSLVAKINSFAMSCYRTFLGIRRTDRVPNEQILAKVGKKPLIDSVRNRQLGWVGHTFRQYDDEPAKIFAFYVPVHGKYKKGPRKEDYLLQIAKLISNAPEYVTTEHINACANERGKWEKIVAAYGQS